MEFPDSHLSKHKWWVLLEWAHLPQIPLVIDVGW